MKTKNTYFYPIKNVNNMKITYNESPAHVERLKHAVDFIVPEGTLIVAACEGVVVDVKQDSDLGGVDERFDAWGNYIEIRHSNNEYSIYEHLMKQSSKVKVGDTVKQGQIIGHSGNTGWMAHLGPHLHFDVHTYFGTGSEDYETLEIVWSS